MLLHRKRLLFNAAGGNRLPLVIASQLAMSMIALTGCGEPAACIYVDNGGHQAMTVTINDDQTVVIEPRDFKWVSLPPGKYHFVVERGGRQLYNGMRTLEQSERLGFGRAYVWNPGCEHNYASCKVLYGSEAVGDLANNAIVKLAEAKTGQKVDAVRVEFIKLKREAEPMPATDWFELPHGIQHVLHDAPDEVVTRGSSETRRVLTRVPRDVRDMLERCHAVENPTLKDLNALALAAERTRDTLADLEPMH